MSITLKIFHNFARRVEPYFGSYFIGTDCVLPGRELPWNEQWRKFV